MNWMSPSDSFTMRQIAASSCPNINQWLMISREESRRGKGGIGEGESREPRFQQVPLPISPLPSHFFSLLHRDSDWFDSIHHQILRNLRIGLVPDPCIFSIFFIFVISARLPFSLSLTHSNQIESIALLSRSSSRPHSNEWRFTFDCDRFPWNYCEFIKYCHLCADQRLKKNTCNIICKGVPSTFSLVRLMSNRVRNAGR